MLKLRVSIIQAKRSVIVILITILLSDCGVNTSVPVSTLGITPTFPSALPTAAMPLPAPFLTSTPTSALPISSAPDGLRMAYSIDGNLYFQDGSKSPIQLTDSGKDWRPLFFSENGESIFFFRGIIPFDFYSINIDGSQEQALVTNSTLLALGMEYDEATTVCNPTIVPNTQLILFNTCVYPELNNSYIISGNRDLLAVDTNTGEIKTLYSPRQAGYFYISPDGKQLAIDKRGQIDIVDINGKIIRSNLLTYTPSEPILLLPRIYWTQDSTDLIVILPVPTFYDTSGGAPQYTVWRYALDGSSRVQMPLDPLPKSHNIAQVSPNGNWILYENDETFSFYLGDLREGSVQIYEPYPPVIRYEWSRDNKHFIYEFSGDMLLGSVASSATIISKGDLIGWVDANRYLYYDYAVRSIVMGELGRESRLVLANVPKALFPSNPDSFIFTWTSE